MNITKRDWLFLALIVAVAGTFYAISGKEKTKTVPNDTAHRIVYEAAYRNKPGPNASFFDRMFFKPDKQGAEVYCEPCHQKEGIPFPPNHPPKNRCLLCHKLMQL